MTDDMAAKVLADPEVQGAIAHEGQLPVVVQPVENLMTAEVLPRGPAETFTARVRLLLSRHAPDKFLWVMNRDAFYRLRARQLEGGMDLGPSPDAVQPKYALTARFSSLTDESSAPHELLPVRLRADQPGRPHAALDRQVRGEEEGREGVLD